MASGTLTIRDKIPNRLREAAGRVVIRGGGYLSTLLYG